MTKEYEKARMLLGRWAALPERLEELSRERRWAQERQEDPREDGGVWQALIDGIDRELAEAMRLRAAVEGVLNALGEPMASVVRLRYVRRLSYPQIARELNYSVAGVRHRKSRADRAVGAAMGIGGEGTGRRLGAWGGGAVSEGD